MADASPAAFPPVFVVGAHRSGTTLLGLMLRGHPQMAFLGEFEYAVDFFSGGSWPAPHELRRLLATDRRFRAQAFEVDPALEGRALVDSFLDQTRARQGGKPRVGATFHRHFDRVASLWPDARIVHLLRDGRDVAMSRIGMGWAGNVWTSCGAWLRMEELWDRVEPTVSDRSHEVRYEDLVTRPEETLRRLCSFLALDWEPEALLSYPERSRYGPPDPKLAAQWRSRLSSRDLALLEHEIGSMLERRGYPRSGASARPPTRAEGTWLRVQDRLARVRFRLRRFGVPLVVADFTARRLGWRSLQRRIQHRMDAITTQHLR